MRAPLRAAPPGPAGRRRSARPPVKSRSLLAQVLAVNLLLIASTMLVVTLVVANQGTPRGREAVVFGLAVRQYSKRAA